MAIIIDEITQRSPEWFDAILGNLGASGISKIITDKGEPSKQADDYRRQLVGEIITGQRDETFKSIHMEQGIEREDSTRAFFEMLYDVEVRQVGLVYKDEQKKFHCSPDGLVGDNAGFEQKNPMMKTQVKYLESGKLPQEYFSQIQMSLYTCEREYWWFMSRYPLFTPGHKPLATLILKIGRDDEFIAKLEVVLEAFCYSLSSAVKKLKEK